MNTTPSILPPKQGRLGTIASIAEDTMLAYVVPEKIKKVEVDISILNTNPTDITLNLAIGLSDTIALEDYIEYGFILPANSVLERTVKCSSFERIMLQTSLSGVVIRVSGYEGI